MSDKKPESIHERLRDAREAAGLSQAQIAKKLGLHRPTISEIEAGRRRVAAEEIEKFAEMYGVSTDWLIHGPRDDSDASAKVLIAARELSRMSTQDLDRLMRMIQMFRGPEK